MSTWRYRPIPYRSGPPCWSVIKCIDQAHGDILWSRGWSGGICNCYSLTSARKVCRALNAADAAVADDAAREKLEARLLLEQRQVFGGEHGIRNRAEQRSWLEAARKKQAAQPVAQITIDRRRKTVRIPPSDRVTELSCNQLAQFMAQLT